MGRIRMVAAALVTAALVVGGGTAASASASASAGTGFDLESALIPASCGHPASRLHDGVKDFGTRSDGSPRGDASLVEKRYSGVVPIPNPIFAKQRQGGQQRVAIAAPIRCSAGGVDYPQTVVLYGPTGAILASRRLDSDREHSAVTSIALRSTHVRVHWDAYDGAGFHIRHLAATFTLRDGALVRT